MQVLFEADPLEKKIHAKNHIMGEYDRIIATSAKPTRSTDVLKDYRRNGLALARRQAHYPTQCARQARASLSRHC
jgi:hypothetical protein